MEKALVTALFVALPALAVALMLHFRGRKVDWAALAWAGVACLVYFLLLRSRGVLPEPAFLEGLRFNWFGKALSISGTLLMIWLLPRASFQAAGFTTQIRKGSLGQVALVGGSVLALSVAVSIFSYPSPDTSPENLLFQATMPGLDEEFFFRGLLLLLLTQAFGRDLRIWGAETGWGLWVVALIFGTLHGVSLENGEVAFNYPAMAFTTFIGFILTWMRERTGTVLIPVLYHNIYNVVLAFV